jgi:hypothetical protein
MPLSFSTGASKALGFASRSNAIPASGAVYSFVSSPFGTAGLAYPDSTAVPPVLLETSNNLNANSFNFYVHGAGANAGYVDGRPLFWRIKHITTTAMDFGATSGTFTSNNWGTSVYNPGYSWYNNPYGEELARFGIYIIAENVTEGTETFQVEIREASYSGPVVLTSPVISLADTSAPITFSFDTAWNNTVIQNGLVEGTTYEFRVNGINLSTGEEYPVIAPDGHFTYYTIDGMPINYNYPNSQYYTWAINKNEGTQWAQVLPAMYIYVKNAEYFDNVVRPGYGNPTNTTRKETFGSGKFYISPRNDGVSEGPTTHIVQLRTSFMNPDYTGGAVIDTFSFTINGQPGQQEYTTPGTYSWTAPAGVTSVSVVAVGGGGNGTLFMNSGVAKIGGGGGGLGWKNNIPVIPGNSYTVVVGAASQDSFFIDSTTVKGGYGGGGFNGGGGTWVGDGGGNGGSGSVATLFNNQYIGGGGGGGAGGYSGNGGNAGIARNNNAPGFTLAQNGSGGGGAGGYSYFWGGPSYFGGGHGGGGVGIYGEGTSGTTMTTGFNPTGPGSGGSGGGGGGSTYYGFYGGGTGGSYGAGGGGAHSNNSSDTGLGGTGAVRIIWGPGRAFPSTNTANL